MKKQTKIILFSGLGILAVGGIAFAAQGYKDHREMKRMFNPQKIMQQIDTNSDQAISLDELNQAMGERFALADTDSDGAVAKKDVVSAIESQTEIKRHSGRFADRLFVGADINEDGSLTHEEMENRIGKFYALADWNDDGKVEMAELKRLRSSMPGRWGKRHGKKNKN